MSILHEPSHDDEQLVRYLLRLLDDREAERLDEMSISDEEVAWRLRVVENDLVDAYVSGGLSGEMLERFESFYLSSERRRRKVRFAGSFLSHVDRGPAGTDAGRDAMRAPAAERDAAPSRGAPSYGGVAPRSRIVWKLMAAAALLLVALGGLLVRDVRLRQGLTDAERERVALRDRTQELEQQLNEQRAAHADDVTELARIRTSIAERSAAARPPETTPPASPVLATTALVLLPQTRAVGTIATLDVPPGTDRATFELRLDSNRFPRYQVALKDPATNQTVWRSGRLGPTSPPDLPAVSISIPVRVLKPQHYSLELIGHSAAGSAQVVGSYAVRIVLR